MRWINEIKFWEKYIEILFIKIYENFYLGNLKF